MVDAQNIAWVRAPVTWGMIPDWEETIWSIKVMAPVMVYGGFLIDPPECLPLVLHGPLWDFPNKKATQGGSILIFLSFLGIISLLESLGKYFKDQWFILWCQTRISLSSHPKGSLVYHSLAVSSLVILAPIEYFPPPTIWWVFGMGSWPELEVLLLPPGSCIGPKYGFTGVSPGILLGELL